MSSNVGLGKFSSLQAWRSLSTEQKMTTSIIAANAGPDASQALRPGLDFVSNEMQKEKAALKKMPQGSVLGANAVNSLINVTTPNSSLFGE